MKVSTINVVVYNFIPILLTDWNETGALEKWVKNSTWRCGHTLKITTLGVT